MGKVKLNYRRVGRAPEELGLGAGAASGPTSLLPHGENGKREGVHLLLPLFWCWEAASAWKSLCATGSGGTRFTNGKIFREYELNNSLLCLGSMSPMDILCGKPEQFTLGLEDEKIP